MKLLRTRFAIATAALAIGGALPVALGSPPEAGAAAPEFAAITTDCLGGVPGDVASFDPTLYVTLYNLPSGASPAATATVSAGGTSAPVTLAGPSPVPHVNGSYFFQQEFTSPAVSGYPVSVSVTWNDGVGGKGVLGPQVVGVPNCQLQPVRSAAAIAANRTGTGYWDVTTDGSVFASGQQETTPGETLNYSTLNYGGMTFVPLNAPIVGMASTTDGEGYWLLGGDGGVFSFGDAPFYGSTGGLRLNAPVVAMAATPDGGGYWFVASDGGVFAYGDAGFYGSMGGKYLNAPIVGMAVDQATGGYWLVASDGGVFAFNAPFNGSAGSLVLNSPIIGMEAAPDGSGYRLGARDGGVFSYNLPFAGSYSDQDSHPMVGIAGQGSTGDWLLDSCGGVYTFGSAQFYGSESAC